MSNTFTLDDIRAAADKKYGSTDIPLDEERTLHLVNVLQLPKEDRKKLKAVQSDLDAEKAEENDDEDAQVEMLRNAIRIIAKEKALAEELFTALGDNLAYLAVIFDRYTEGTEAGEA